MADAAQPHRCVQVAGYLRGAHNKLSSFWEMGSHGLTLRPRKNYQTIVVTISIVKVTYREWRTSGTGRDDSVWFLPALRLLCDFGVMGGVRGYGVPGAIRGECTLSGITEETLLMVRLVSVSKNNPFEACCCTG